MASVFDNVSPTVVLVISNLTSTVVGGLVVGVLLKRNEMAHRRREREEEAAAATKPDPLTNEEKRIVRLIYDAPGRHAMLVRVFEKREHVQAGRTTLYNHADRTVEEKYLVALHALVRRGIVEETSELVYSFTGPGLEVAMELAKSLPSYDESVAASLSLEVQFVEGTGLMFTVQNGTVERDLLDVGLVTPPDVGLQEPLGITGDGRLDRDRGTAFRLAPRSSYKFAYLLNRSGGGKGEKWLNAKMLVARAVGTEEVTYEGEELKKFLAALKPEVERSAAHTTQILAGLKKQTEKAW